jgi:hypothetical protein
MWVRFRIKPTTWDWDSDGGVSMKIAEFGQGDGDRVIIFMRMANHADAGDCYPPRATQSCNLDPFGASAISCSADTDCDNVCSEDISGCDIQYDGLCDNDSDGVGEGAECTEDAGCAGVCVSGSDPQTDHPDPIGVDYKCISVATVWSNRTGGAFTANDNLAYPCIGPVPADGITNNNWYNVQMVWNSSSTNDGYIKMWVNNTTEGSPDMCIGDGCGNSSGFNHNATNWDTADIQLGYFHGTHYPADDAEQCFTLGHFDTELNGSFDASFGETAPGGSVVLVGVKIGS